jgi:hypothetical protein
MNTEDYTLNKIFINGVEEELAQQLSSQNIKLILILTMGTAALVVGDATTHINR